MRREREPPPLSPLLWGSMRPLVLFCLLSCALSLPLGVQDPACGDLGPGECMARTSKCKLVQKLGQGGGGPVKDVFACAKVMAVPKTRVISVLGPAFASGHPETIMDRIFPNDNATAAQFRRCVLTHGGLVTVNGSLARDTMVKQLLAKGKYTHPAIIDVLAAAISHCPEPENYKIAAFLDCIRVTCVQQMPPGLSYLPTFGLEEGQDDDDDDDENDDDDDD